MVPPLLMPSSWVKLESRGESTAVAFQDTFCVLDAVHVWRVLAPAMVAVATAATASPAIKPDKMSFRARPPSVPARVKLSFMRSSVAVEQLSTCTTNAYEGRLRRRTGPGITNPLTGTELLNR